jgi:hypothetical protein
MKQKSPYSEYSLGLCSDVHSTSARITVFKKSILTRWYDTCTHFS